MPTVLILGSGSDIGTAIAELFTVQGFQVIRAAHRPIRADEIPFEALDFEEHGLFVNELGPLPDVVIQVFGTMPDPDAAYHDPAVAIHTAMVNYVGAVSVLGHLARGMAERGSGTIIGITSVAGDRGRGSNHIYGSSKAGLSAYLDGLRGRLRPHGVHVITVKPGFVATRMTAHIRLPPALTATPDQVARSVFRAYRRSADSVYVLSVWRYIMAIVRLMPEAIFKRMRL